MIIPNDGRVIIRRIKQTGVGSSPIVIPGQLLAGENLFVGVIVHPGDTKFHKGQVVYYSEYSAAATYDIGSVLRGEKNLSQVTGSDNSLFIVAEDDVMACEDQDVEVPEEYFKQSDAMAKTLAAQHILAK